MRHRDDSQSFSEDELLSMIAILVYFISFLDGLLSLLDFKPDAF